MGNLGYQADYYRTRGFYEHTVKREAYLQFLAELLIKKLQSQTVLDVGCGLGQFVFALRKLSVQSFGVDFSEAAISDKLENGFFLTDVDSEGLPFGDDTFDLVTSLEVVEHLCEPQKFISEVERVLRPRGFAFITTPSPFPLLGALWNITGRKEELHINMHNAQWWIRNFQSHRLQYAGNLRREISAWRMVNGYSHLPFVEKTLWILGKAGKYAVTRVHALGSAPLLFQKSGPIE